MHIGGHGKNADFAEGVKAMWDAIKEVRKQHAKPVDPSQAVFLILPGSTKLRHLKVFWEPREQSQRRSMLKFTFERSATVHGTEFGAPMGLSTWAAFSGNKEHAVVDGDFAMTADEVQAVMHACEANIHIIWVHNHMVGETPPYYFFTLLGQRRSRKTGARNTLSVKSTEIHR